MANNPPIIGNTVSIIDNTISIISTVLRIEAIKGNSSTGIRSRNTVQMLVAARAMVNPMTDITLIIPVVMFRTPAIVGFADLFMFYPPCTK